MARTCTICSHPKLVNIDRQLLRGDMLNGIAHRFHVSPDAVGRHRRHMRTAMLKVQAAAEKQDLVYGQTLIEEVKAIKADAERLQLEAEGRRDIRAALQAIRERVGIVELQAKLMGEIQTGNRSVTVNLQTISPQEALEYARDILELFSPDSALQPELPILLIAGDTDWFWHYDYLCEMLTLVKQRRLLRLIINIPPRTLKSTLVRVVYPSWVWLTEPEHNFLTASYSLDLSTEHSVTRRSLLSEPMVPAAFRRPLPVCRRPQSSGAIRQRPARPDDCDLGR